MKVSRHNLFNGDLQTLTANYEESREWVNIPQSDSQSILYIAYSMGAGETANVLNVKFEASPIAISHDTNGPGHGMMYANTISFEPAAPAPGSLAVISDSANNFIEAGFYPGQEINISGSVANDGIYTIATDPHSVTTGTLTLVVTDVLAAEVAGNTIDLSTFFFQETLGTSTGGVITQLQQTHAFTALEVAGEYDFIRIPIPVKDRALRISFIEDLTGQGVNFGNIKAWVGLGKAD